MHAPDSGCVTVESVFTDPGLCVPNLKGPVSAAADNDIPLHLRRPHASSVSHQRPQTPPSAGVPHLSTKQMLTTRSDFRLCSFSHLESVVVWTRDDSVIAELEASDDVVVVTLEDLLVVQAWSSSPVVLDLVLPHKPELRKYKHIWLRRECTFQQQNR